MELGKQLAPLPPGLCTDTKRVVGCQSAMHLDSQLIDGQMHFRAHSDALIASGLAWLMLSIYDGEAPEVLLTTPPKVLEELGISNALSPNRSNGLHSLHLRMKQDALALLVTR